MAPDHGHPIAQLPLVPTELLKQHHVHEKFDTRFRSCARLLQALWRERQDLSCGTFASPGGRKRRLGSLLAPATADAGRNFMSPAIAHLVRREVAYQEAGALIERNRLFTNLLSSMPLTFNAFAPLRFDADLAARVLRRLLPSRDIAAVRHVWFEHSPGRHDLTLTGDRSAFDVAVVYDRADGAAGFVGIEMKYSEALSEPPPQELNACYDRLARTSDLFKYPDHAALRVNPFQQLFREHMLAQAVRMRGDYAEATFVLIAPRHNSQVQKAASLYAAFLQPAGEGQAPFVNRHLEAYLDALHGAGARSEAIALFDRYLDWHQIDDAVETSLLGRAADWKLTAPARSPLRLVGKVA